MAVALALTAGLLGIRLAAAPAAAGYRHALAPAPGGAAYSVEGDQARLLSPAGRRRVGDTRGGLPLALAADGAFLVLGTDHGVQVSTDGGATWRDAPVPAAGYPAVFASGSIALAGGWARRLMLSTDRGVTWSALDFPGSGEFQAIAELDGIWYVATLTGVLRSADGGRHWEDTGLPPRITALTAVGSSLLAGGWRGDVWSIEPGRPPVQVARVGGGIWALSGHLVATTDGVHGDDARPILPQREVTALVGSGDALYAGLARGPVLASTDGGRTWR